MCVAGHFIQGTVGLHISLFLLTILRNVNNYPHHLMKNGKLSVRVTLAFGVKTL